MEATFNEFTEKYEKVHQLKMISDILARISKYAHEISEKIEDEFDCYDDVTEFDVSGTDIALNRIKNDIQLLKEYL